MFPLLMLILAVDWKADFCGHSVPHAGTTYFTADHIVVEVEVLPDKAPPLRLAAEQFRLRLNGKLLAPDAPGMVAGGLKSEDWNQRPRLEAQAGPVILGAPRQQPRFPGDRQPASRPGVVEKQEPTPAKTDAEAVVDAALPEGPTQGPTKGLLYFPFRGKMKAIKTIEILWGDRELKLR